MKLQTLHCDCVVVEVMVLLCIDARTREWIYTHVMIISRGEKNILFF